MARDGRSSSECAARSGYTRTSPWNKVVDGLTPVEGVRI